jgi:hypothetical protein
MAGKTQSGDMAAAAKRFYRLAKGVEVATFTVSREQALDTQYLLAKDTPVDVGSARSNWRISIGRPLTGRIKAYYPYASRHRPPYGPGGSKGEGANLSAVINQGRMRLASYKTGSIYISNNLPYIGPLDRGHSKQTTSGFVARAVYAATRQTAIKIPAIFSKEFSK